MRDKLDALCAELGRSRPPLGAMIETPAAAMLADAIAAEVDFLSIGTNDLAQYTLAMDRGHAELAARIDGMHPAVLRLIAATTRGAARHRPPGRGVRRTRVRSRRPCRVLIGLGVTELSVVPKLIPQSKALIRGLTLERCRALAVAVARTNQCRRSARVHFSRSNSVKNLIAKLQPMGRALMLPIAVLPVAALLLRLGQPDLLDVPAIAAAGDAIFSNLGLLFAIGVAVGLARENHGAAGLAERGRLPGRHQRREGADRRAAGRDGGPHRARCSDLAAGAFRAKELAKLSVPVGLISGLIAGWAYNRFSDIRLPSYLAFFGGRRFVPIVSGCAGIVLALCFGFGWQTLEHGMDAVQPGGARFGRRSGCSPTACSIAC